MTVKHPNFYETLEEAVSRLRGTLVLYDGQPVFIHAITNHKDDKIFRVYAQEIGLNREESNQVAEMQGIASNYHSSDTALGHALDKWMVLYPAAKVMRKHINSPYFNSFRPFPLGMCNVKGQHAVYVERIPDRPKMEQGLTGSMINEAAIRLGPPNTRYGSPVRNIALTGSEIKDCILGVYPSPQRCLVQLLESENESAAFDRNFAFLQGPIGTVYLAYKSEIVGFLPQKNLSVVRLGEDFSYLKEVVSELNIFTNVIE